MMPMWWRELQAQFEGSDGDSASIETPEWLRLPLWFNAVYKLNCGEISPLATALESSEPVLREYFDLLIVALRDVELPNGRKLSYRLDVVLRALSSQKKAGRPRKTMHVTKEALANWIEAGSLQHTVNRHMLAAAIRDDGSMPFRLVVTRNIRGRFPDDKHYRNIIVATRMAYLMKSSKTMGVRAAALDFGLNNNINLGDEAILKILYTKIDLKRNYYDLGKEIAEWASELQLAVKEPGK